MTTFSRRDFLKRSLSLGAGVTTASSLGMNMALANAAVKQSSTRFDDYKALVCVFLYGGNDSLNMLVPTDSAEYQVYQASRQNLAYAQSDLVSLQPVHNTKYAVGVPNAMSDLGDLFNQGKLAFTANTGTLVQPVSKSQLLANKNLLPSQLFSHNDQQAQWHTAETQAKLNSGWAGRMADLLIDSNTALPMNLSIFGNNLWQTGGASSLFNVNTTGPEKFAGLDPEQEWNRHRIDVFNRILGMSTHPMEKQYKSVIDSAQSNNVLLSSALLNLDETNVVYPDGHLAEQLRMVAKLASVQSSLGQQRQIFYVGLGGWDTHDDQNTRHPRLLTELSQALMAFQSNLEELNLGEQVTTFTQSDFGRTLTSNGDGTDHGWGSHQIVMGGSVNGGRIVGQLPEQALNSVDDLDDGRIIPTLSVEQYGASLAKWFGMSDNELHAVFPHLDRFDASSLGLFS